MSKIVQQLFCCVLIYFGLSFARNCLAIDIENSTEPLQAEQFSIQTKDRITVINGEINYRGSKDVSRPVVFLLHGSGPSDRDYLLQDPLADKSQFTWRHALFKELSEQLTLDGFAIVRFDTRGVSCNRLTYKNNEGLPSQWTAHCFDNTVLLSATLSATIDDVQTVIEYASNRPMVNANQTAFITHSAGVIYLGHLVERNLVSPKIVISLAGLVESPYASALWQNTIRYVNIAEKCDLNRDGVLTLKEWNTCSMSVQTRNGASVIFEKNLKKIVLADLKSKWLPERSTAVKASWNRMKEYSEAERNQPSNLVGGIMPSPKSYMADLLSDTTPVVARYAQQSGTLIYYHGGKDDLVDSKFQLKSTARNNSDLKNIRFREFAKLGHSLGEDPVVGPMHESVMPLIREDLKAAFQK
jgi:predicted esterase